MNEFRAVLVRLVEGSQWVAVLDIFFVVYYYSTLQRCTYNSLPPMVVPHRNDAAVDLTEFLHQRTVRVVVAAHPALRGAHEELSPPIIETSGRNIGIRNVVKRVLPRTQYQIPDLHRTQGRNEQCEIKIVQEHDARWQVVRDGVHSRPILVEEEDVLGGTYNSIIRFILRRVLGFQLHMGQRLEARHIIKIALGMFRLEGLDAAEGSQIPQFQYTSGIGRDQFMSALDGVAVHERGFVAL